ncbi:MAG TPA: hypothetical protein VKE69_13895 [Planctomycetota bacterium]|nr:hypothetical protein [Planctomycetota bacterium]
MLRIATLFLASLVATSVFVVGQDNRPTAYTQGLSQVREPDSGVLFPREISHKDLGMAMPQKLVALGVNEGFLGKNRYALGVYLEDAQGALSTPMPESRAKDREAFRDAVEHSKSPKSFRIVLVKDMDGADLAKEIRDDLTKRLETTARFPDRETPAADGKQDAEMVAKDFTRPLETEKFVKGDHLLIALRDKGVVVLEAKERKIGEQTSPHLSAALCETFVGKNPAVDLKSVAEVLRDDHKAANAGYGDGKGMPTSAPAKREMKPPTKNP